MSAEHKHAPATISRAFAAGNFGYESFENWKADSLGSPSPSKHDSRFVAISPRNVGLNQKMELVVYRMENLDFHSPFSVTKP